MILGNWWYRNFFQKKAWFSWKTTKMDFFSFSLCYKNIKIKSLLQYRSVCGRVVKTSGLSPALTSYNRPIRGSSPGGAWLGHLVVPKKVTCLFENNIKGHQLTSLVLPLLNCWYINLNLGILQSKIGFKLWKLWLCEFFWKSENQTNSIFLQNSLISQIHEKEINSPTGLMLSFSDILGMSYLRIWHIEIYNEL